MRVMHSARRTLALAALAALAAGCGGDSTGPADAPFEAEGTSADLAAVGASFESPAVESFTFASGEIGQVTNGAATLAVRALPTAAIVTGGKAGALRYGKSLARSFVSAGPRPSLATVSAAAIPNELLGTTFVYDPESNGGEYVASELDGAPANGVRFLLYAVNPLSGEPVEPLVEIGYADVRTTETETSSSGNILVVSEGVTYLDYTFQLTVSSSSSVSFGASGYVTNGDDRVNFDLDNVLTEVDSTLRFQIDYLLTVPTRGGFRIDLEATTADLLSETTTLTLDLTARGPHGTVNISGTATGGTEQTTGTFEVEVNGDLFATLTIGPGTATVTGADGEPLTGAEADALEDVFEVFAGGVAFFTELLMPLA